MVMRKVMVAVLVTGLVAGNGAAMNGQNDKDPIKMFKNAVWNANKGAVICGAAGMGMSIIGQFLSPGRANLYIPQGMAIVGAQLGILCAGLKSLADDLSNGHGENALRSAGVYGGTLYLLSGCLLLMSRKVMEFY